MRLIWLWIPVFVVVLPACAAEEHAGFGQTSSESSSDPTSGGPASPTEATSADVPEPGSTGDASSGDTGDTSSGDSGAAPFCGDGVVDPGEMCDDGDALNVETGACLPNCVLATCGDGLVQAGAEQCDLGAANSHEYGGCVPGTCFWGPACGDGEVTPGHEICDPGAPVDPRGGEIIPCGQDCRFEGRNVFLSSTTYDGKQLGGLIGADTKCQQLASVFDPLRYHTYRAWLSDGAGEPASTFDHGVVPYVLLNGVPIAGSFDDLVQNGPAVGITITDEYEAVPDVRVWTHTTAVGTKIPDEHHCEQWTSDAFNQVAMLGRNSVPADEQETWADERWWTRYSEVACNIPWHLYCFEN